MRGDCDNWAACKIVQWGSTKVDCMRVAVRINALVMRFNMEFEIVWQPRETEEIRFADCISKDFDFADYRISMEDFQTGFSVQIFRWGGTFSDMSPPSGGGEDKGLMGGEGIYA